MDFVKREEHNALEEESYKLYLENLQKTHQFDATEYQHTQISMEQLHQAMQSSLNATTIVHNFQLPLSPRQMSTLMLKTNHIPAHLPRNLTSEIDFIHSLANELPQHLGRHEDLMLTQSLGRTLDLNLARTLSNELELQNGLTQNLVQSLSEQDCRNINAELNQSLGRLNELNIPQNLGRIEAMPQDLGHELDLSLHLNRQNVEQEILSHEEARRSPVAVQCVQENHLLEQNLNQRLEQNVAQRLEQNLVQSLAQRLDQTLVQRLDHNLVQRLDQRLVNSALNLHEANQRQVEHNDHLLSMPFHIKSEQEDEYFYENINQGLDNVGALNGHVSVHPETVQGNSTNLHQEYTIYNGHLPNIPTLNGLDLYSRTQNYVQNYTTNNISTDNPQNLIVHRQFENGSPYSQEEFKKLRQDGAHGGKTDSPKIEDPKENLKPTDQNKIYYANYEHVHYDNNSDKCPTGHSPAESKLVMSDDMTMNIKGEYVCYRCNNVFPSKRGLKQHAKACTDGVEGSETSEKTGKFTCSQCAYRCQSPAILKIHERIHSGEKPFSCTFCDYKSGQKNNVAKHILVHMKEKPFRCQYCEYRCAQKNNLVVHERTHTGYKPFACPYCDYRTVQKPNLVKHMYLHTDQKPFSCDICSYRCVQKTNLTKHKQRHINEKNGVKIEVKSQAKPYRPRQKSVKCSHCSYRCVQKSSLDKHMQFKHGEYDNSEFSPVIHDQQKYEQGLNLMKNDTNVCTEETIQNLSVKKDDVYENVCQEKIVEPLQIQS